MARQAVNVDDSTFLKLQKLRIKYTYENSSMLSWPELVAEMLRRLESLEREALNAANMLDGYANTHTARTEKAALIKTLRELAGES